MTLTANAELAIRQTGQAEFVELATIPTGVSGFNFSDTARTRPIPSIPATLAVQRLEVKDARVGFTIDDNEVTNPLLFMRSGKDFDVRIRRLGEGSGNPQVTLTGPASINVTNAEAGARSYQFNLTARTVVYESQ